MRRFKSIALCFFCLTFWLIIQLPAFATVVVYSYNSQYAIYDDTISSSYNCTYTNSKNNKIATYLSSSQADCLTRSGFPANSQPASQTSTQVQENTFMEALFLLCWTDFVSFGFYSLALLLFLQMLPS